MIKVGDHKNFTSDKYTFEGTVVGYPADAPTIQGAIMTDGPVEAAFTVYSDFEVTHTPSFHPPLATCVCVFFF
jgi:hypothetical protein